MIVLTLILPLSLTPAFVSVQDNGTLPAAKIAAVEERYFNWTAAGVDVSLYHVDYRSPGYSGETRILSGLLALPTGGAPKGLVVYYHSTTVDRENVPSRLRAEGGPGEAEAAVAAFCGDGYAVLEPDMIGLGDDPGIHPYARASINCLSGIDMVAPTREFAAAHGRLLGAPLFVTGYSEGGAVAMWAAKTLEQGTTAVSGCAPLSGAYDLSGTEARAILESQSNPKWLAARIFLASYIGYTWSRLDPRITLADIFTPSFASYVERVFGRDRDDDKIIRELATRGLELGAVSNIKRLLQPALVRAIEGHDATNAVVARLVAEDCFDWQPTAPLCMVSLARDYLVPPQNGRRALDAMRARGVASGLVSVDEFPEHAFDHITFLPRALRVARDFFDQIKS